MEEKNSNTTPTGPSDMERAGELMAQVRAVGQAKKVESTDRDEQMQTLLSVGDLRARTSELDNKASDLSQMLDAMFADLRSDLSEIQPENVMTEIPEPEEEPPVESEADALSEEPSAATVEMDAFTEEPSAATVEMDAFTEETSVPTAEAPAPSEEPTQSEIPDPAEMGTTAESKTAEAGGAIEMAEKAMSRPWIGPLLIAIAIASVAAVAWFGYLRYTVGNAGSDHAQTPSAQAAASDQAKTADVQTASGQDGAADVQTVSGAKASSETQTAKPPVITSPQDADKAAEKEPSDSAGSTEQTEEELPERTVDGINLPLIQTDAATPTGMGILEHVENGLYIGTIAENPDLYFTVDQQFASEEARQAAWFRDALWYTETEGEQETEVYYTTNLVGAVIDYYNEEYRTLFEEYNAEEGDSDSGSTEEVETASDANTDSSGADDTDADRTETAESAKAKESAELVTLSRLELGEMRRDDDDFYMLVRLFEREGDRATSAPRTQLVHLVSEEKTVRVQEVLDVE